MKINVKDLEQIERTTNTFYVVTRGREVGIYADDASARQQTNRFPQGRYYRAKGRREAVRILDEKLSARSETLNENELETVFSLYLILSDDDFKPLEFPSLI